MNRQKKIKSRMLSLVMGSLLIAGSLFAQPAQNRNHPPMLPDSSGIVQMVDELATNLSLTDEQKVDVSKIYFAHFVEAEELMEEHKGDRENHRKAMDDLRQEFEEQVKDLLTDEQKIKFEKSVKNNRPRPGQQHPKH